MPNPKKNADKLAQAVNAWETLAPDKSFAGVTLAEFKATLQKSSDVRAAMQAAADEAMAHRATRGDNDAESLKLVQRVVSAIKADADHGDDSALYEAFGYTRSSQRKSGLSRKAKTAVSQPKPA